MRLFLILFALLTTFSCATRNINYDREKIINKYSSDFNVYVDSEKVNLEYLYLDKDNIEKTIINKRTKTVQIKQFNKIELFDLNKLNSDSLNSGRRGWNKNKIELVVIDGIPLINGLKEKVKIDPNAIKFLKLILKKNMNNMTWCRSYDGDVLIIRTKQ